MLIPLEMVLDVFVGTVKESSNHIGSDLNQDDSASPTMPFEGEPRAWTFPNSKAGIQRIGCFRWSNILIAKGQRKKQK